MTGGDIESMEMLKKYLTGADYSVIVATPQTVLNYFNAYRYVDLRPSAEEEKRKVLGPQVQAPYVCISD